MITLNNKPIEYLNPMTVLDAIRAAGETVDLLTIVLMNDDFVAFDQLGSTFIEDGAIIKSMKIASGG